MVRKMAEQAGDLVGVPGLGPVRRAALLAAGVTNRADLARASVEQIVSMTGMGRKQADDVRAFVQADGARQVAKPAPSIAADEAMPEEAAPFPAPSDEPAAEQDDDGEAVDTVVSEFDRVLFAARTALSDASRTWASGERLQKPFVRLARRLDTAEDKNNKGTLTSGRRKRIQRRLLILVDRMEKGAQKAAPQLSPKREEQLRERLQNESRALAGLLAKPVKRQAVPQPEPFKSNKKAGK